MTTFYPPAIKTGAADAGAWVFKPAGWRNDPEDREVRGDRRTAPPANVAAGGDQDRAGMLNRFQGRLDLLDELSSIFLDSAPALLVEIRSALLCRDDHALRYATRTMKGLAGVLGATEFQRTATQLDEMVRTGQQPGAEALFADLEADFQNLMRVLSDWRRSRAA